MIEPTKRRGPTPGRALMPGDRPTTWIMVTNWEHRPAYIHEKTVLGLRAEVTGEGTEINTNDTTTTEEPEGEEKPWRSLLPIDNLGNRVTSGKKSRERETQSIRERSTPQTQYTEDQTPPDSPSEAEPEAPRVKINNAPTDDTTYPTRRHDRKPQKRLRPPTRAMARGQIRATA